MRLKSCLPWFFHKNLWDFLWDFHGFLYLQPTAKATDETCGLTEEHLGSPQDLGEDAAPRAAEAPAASWFGRWCLVVDLCGSVNRRFGGIFWKICFSGHLFENVGKTPVFWICGFWIFTKHQGYSKAIEVDFTWWQAPSIFLWFQRDSTSLTTALTSGIFGGHFFGGHRF